ncbi:MAG: hypothetical protein GY820_04160 [Gammaproteobacteria bacterium]|nr:hypothetical protein [Gammaproteobacteria bacterium]
MFKSTLFGAVCILCLVLPAQANSLRIFTLGADEWARPRSGAVIAEFAALRSAVTYWETGADHGILIRYPGEDSGEIWATELRDWLISLGIPTDYIELVPGSQAADEIRLIVGKRSDFQQ